MIFSHVCFQFQEKMEEGKKEGSKEEKKKEEVKDEKKEGEEEEASPEIVLKVDMHCEACARKVARALKGFEGVEKVSADSKGSKVVVKGKGADPMKVCERLQKKSGRKVELISPLPKPPTEQQKKKEEEEEEEDKEAQKQQPEEKKEEAPAAVTVVLKVGMHCEACAQVIQKQIRKIQGVESVETDLGNDKVVVKGVIEPNKLVEYVYKRTGKQASIVKEEEKKEEEKKEEEDKKKEEEHKEEEEEEDNDQTDIIKRMEHWPSKYFTDYAYAPQFFSDENPNACSLM